MSQLLSFASYLMLTKFSGCQRVREGKAGLPGPCPSEVITVCLKATALPDWRQGPWSVNVAPDFILENGFFTLDYSFEEICYSQLVKLTFPDSLFWRVGMKGTLRNCFHVVRASLELHLQEGCFDSFTPTSQEGTSRLAGRFSSQLCLGLALMSYQRWAPRQDEQGNEAMAGK